MFYYFAFALMNNLSTIHCTQALRGSLSVPNDNEETRSFNFAEAKDYIEKNFNSQLVKLSETNNVVFKFVVNNKEYVIKQFSNSNGNIENKFAKFIGFPKVIYCGTDFRIEEFVNFTKIDYIADLEKIAVSLRSLHRMPVAQPLSFLPRYDLMLNYFYCSFMDSLKIIESVKTTSPKKLKESKCLFKKIYRRVCQLIVKNRLSFDKICHNDLNFNNIWKIRNNIKFIDYEFVSLNDPLLDIARFFYLTKRWFTRPGEKLPKQRWNKKMKLKFLKSYYGKDVKKSFLKNKLKVISSIGVITNYFYFLHNLFIISSDLSQDISVRVRRLKNHLGILKKKGFISYEEHCKVTKIIIFLENESKNIRKL